MSLFDIFSDKPAQQAAQAQQAGLTKGYGLASGLYDAGRGALTTNYGTAADAFKGLQAGTQRGADSLADAVGANGPEGLERARKLFVGTPGYTEGINMALNQNDARAASRGMLGSGNTAVDTTKLATDYANQKYGDYTSKLAPYLGANQGAVAGQAGVATGLGSALNQNNLSQAGLGFQTQAGIGNAQANADLAKYSTSANLINSLLKVAGLGSGGLGSIFGGTGAGGSGGTMGWAPSPNGPGTTSPMFG